MEKQEAENRALAEERRREAEEEARRVAAQKEAELKERQDMIRQLRAMLKAKEKFERKVDPTWVPNLGLLGEMSLLELRQRVAQVNAWATRRVGRSRRRPKGKEIGITGTPHGWSTGTTSLFAAPLDKGAEGPEN